VWKRGIALEALLISLPLAKAQSIGTDNAVVRGAVLWANQNPDSELSLNNAWAALHFTLTGEYPIPRQIAEERGMSWDEASLENAIMGGTATPFQSAYGPVRYLAPQLVRSIARELENITLDEFCSRIDPEALSQEEMLPESWDPEVVVNLLPQYFTKLKGLYMHAEAAGNGMLIYFK
jgi:hypothetical protein